MDKKLNNLLPVRHINEAADEILQYIDNRRNGIIKSLATKWPKFNNQCMGGIEPNVVISVAGISGSGKSSFINSLETDLFDLNPDVDFVVLSFNFEMLSSKQVGRKISYKLKKTTSELYSGKENEKVSDSDMKAIEREADKIRKYEIYYVDMPGTVEEVRSTIVEFNRTTAHGRWVVITFDHTLLTKGANGDRERETLMELERLFMEAKKWGRTTIIQLSQMNREIEQSERINNPQLQFPMRKDIFGSDSVFQASD